MVGIRNLDITDAEFKYYKQWVEETHNTDVQHYISIQIKNKLQELKKLNGRCNQRSIILTKDGYKGSCTWKDECNAYKVYLRGNGINIYYGFFENLYNAERELKQLFKEDETGIVDKAKKQQKYYQEQNRFTTRPKISDTSYSIKAFHNKNGSMVIKFKKPFINPNTTKQQSQITFNKNWLQYFDKKEVMDVCVELDDPIEIIGYREDLIKKLNDELDA